MEGNQTGTVVRDNSFLVDFNRDASQRYNRDSSDMTHGDWMCANTTLNSKRFTFHRYPFQKQIADDLHPNLDCIKPSQVGLTEIQIRKILTWLKRNPGLSAIYTMPNDDMFKRISKGRIQPILEKDKAFRGDTGSMDMIRVGASWLYVTGSAESDATSINADIVFNDEIDLTPSDILALFNSRLQGSDLRVNQRFSTPTWEGVGVDKGFAISDQNLYLIKCECCGHWQEPIFNRTFVEIPGLPDWLADLADLDQKLLDDSKIDLLSAKVVCEKCHKPLNLGDHSRREWVAKYPSRVLNRGYRIRPFSTERLDIPYIITQLLKYKQHDNLKGWYNTVMGEPYTNEESRLSVALLESRILPRAQPEENPTLGMYWVGVDMGKTCHIVIGRGMNLINFEFVEFHQCPVEMLQETLARMDKRYRFAGGGVDINPYTPTSNAIRDQFEGRIMPVEYSQGKECAEVKDATAKVTHISCNRTLLLDYVANGLKKGGIHISGYSTQKALIINHFRDMVREVKVNQHGENVARWVKLTGTDHFFHAAAYVISGMVYRGVLNEIGDYQHTGSVSISQKTMGYPLNLGVKNLIGFSATPPRDKKVVRRKVHN